MDEELDIVTVSLFISKNKQQRNVGAVIHRKSEPSANVTTQSEQVANKTHFVIEFIDFIDNEQFSILDSLLVQIGSCRLILSEEYEQGKGDAKKLSNLFQRKDIDIIYLKKTIFKRGESATKLEKICGKSFIINAAEKDTPNAMNAVEALLHALSLKDTDRMIIDLKLMSLNTFLRLDSAAAEAVNLLPKPDHPSPFGSIYGVLNRCKTKMGQRLLERWVRQPLLDHTEINKRLDIVEILKNFISYRNQLSNEILKSIPDLDTVVTRMQRKNTGLAEVFRLYMFTKSLPRILEVLTAIHNEASEDMKSKSEVLFNKLGIPFQTLQEKFGLYEQLVEHVIDMDKLPELLVNAKHDPELQEIKDEQDEVDAKVDTLLRKVRDGWCSGIDVKLEDSTLHRGLVFRSTRADDEKQIRANNSSARVLSILKNGVHFTIPQLEQLSDRRRELQALYKEKQATLSAKAVETALSYLPVAEAAAGLVAELDVLTSFATVAATASGNYCRPNILPLGSGVIDIQGSRHPCVELMNDVHFIANDYQLVRNESNFHIITGPNMGGKSTYIRGLGSIIVMAQMGSFIPCNDGATISVIDAVLARVGAGDAVQKGVSTFMAEMLEASVILQTASPDSLLIIDELGRGTSTFDGFGIAWAISEHIVKNINCMTLFATHFHELTALESSYPCVKNKHVTAVVENDQLVMMYSLQSGPCLQSFGINVAVSAGFPKSVIFESKRKAAQLENVDHNENDISADENIKRQKVLNTMKSFSMLPLNEIAAESIQPSLKDLFPPYATEAC